MLNKIVFVLLAFLTSTSYINAEQIDNDVKEFVLLLTGGATPSLDDFYKFYGEGSEEELQLEFNVCEQKGWIPPSINSNCLDYMKKRHASREKSISLYFEWLKTKLPASPKIEIIRTERIRGKGIIEHDLIYAKLDGIDVVFFRTIGDKDTKIQFGNLSISKINSVPVRELFSNDLKGILKNESRQVPR